MKKPLTRRMVCMLLIAMLAVFCLPLQSHGEELEAQEFFSSFEELQQLCSQASETPGLGSNLTSEGFMKQFKGMPAARDISVTKDGGEVEAITSATITSRAVCGAINEARARLDKILTR